jgi:hypothetical protein
MTIINGIEIDIWRIPKDETKVAIANNDPIEDKLHVICVISNPCQYARRYILAREFIKRMETESNVILYIVELAYGNQQYYVTEKKNKRHLQLHGDIPLWHKENMINLGVQLLPNNWKAMAWVDADIEFDSASWALDALKLLNGSKDIIQLFSHAVDMYMDQTTMSIFPSFAYQYSKKSKYGGHGVNMWHPGYAWACTKKAYQRMGGLYDLSVLGAGDHNMSLSFIGNGVKSVNDAASDDYKNSVAEFELNAKNLRLGYVPGIIRHYYHGSKKDRKYSERWQILIKHKFAPSEFVTHDKNGLLIPTDKCPQELLDDILKYFAERNEDHMYKDVNPLPNQTEPQ